jgi:hypothetical protein
MGARAIIAFNYKIGVHATACEGEAKNLIAACVMGEWCAPRCQTVKDFAIFCPVRGINFIYGVEPGFG